MMRHTLLKSAQPALHSSLNASKRTFAISALRMAEGDTGATRSGGAASSDAFSKREKASEDMAIKNKEREKFAAIKARLDAQQKHLKELQDHVDEMAKEQGGGEKN